MTECGHYSIYNYNGNCMECRALKAESETANVRSLLKDICDEWDEDCNPTCSSYGHDGDCRSVDIANAKRALNKENIALKQALLNCRMERNEPDMIKFMVDEILAQYPLTLEDLDRR